MIKKYDIGVLRYMSLFEQVCKLQPHDCFADAETVFLLAEPTTIRLAVGKGGSNVRDMQRAIPDKRLKVLEWSEDPSQLIKNFIFPLQAENISIDANKIVNIKFQNAGARRVLLDNKQAELRRLKSLLKHYFPDISDVRILQNE